MASRLMLFVLTILMGWAAAGCGSAPQLIGAYPMHSANSATYIPPPPPSLLVTYNAYLDLDVYDVDGAAQRAEQIAYEHGGYLAASNSWHEDGRKHTTLTLAVPVPHFESARGELAGLGALVRESVSGDLAGGYGADPWRAFSEITVHLRPAGPIVRWPELPSIGWSPARTFERAFGLFAAIFTFIVDVLIWVGVVAGPFVLMGLGARALLRRVRRA